eukprot:13291478-Ditylum_brightwellii.AAC.1
MKKKAVTKGNDNASTSGRKAKHKDKHSKSERHYKKNHSEKMRNNYFKHHGNYHHETNECNYEITSRKHHCQDSCIKEEQKLKQVHC